MVPSVLPAHMLTIDSRVRLRRPAPYIDVMCGRFTLTPEEPELRVLLGDVEWATSPSARYNIAPGQRAPLLLMRHGRARLESVLWGLTPAWSGDSGRGGWINARVETVARRAAFRDAFGSRRGLVPADGFFEWTGAGKGAKQPWHITRADTRLMGLAAIWEEPPGAGFAILTRDAVAALADIHDRMPLVLEREDWEAWLDPATGATELRRIMGRAAPVAFQARPVSRVVNSAAYDGPECLEEVVPEAGSGAADGEAGDDAASGPAGQMSLFG